MSQIDPFLGMVSRTTRLNVKNIYANMRTVLNRIDQKNSFNTMAGTVRPYSFVPHWQRRLIINTGYRYAAAVEAVRDEVLVQLGPAPTDNDDDEEEDEHKVDNEIYTATVKKSLQYYLAQCCAQQALLTPLTSAIDSGNLRRARKAYEKQARIPD